MNTLKNTNRRWKYIRVSRTKVEDVEAAKRDVPTEYCQKGCFKTTMSQYVFRKRLPQHVIQRAVCAEAGRG